MQKIKSIPKKGDKSDDVLAVQAGLLNQGFDPGALDEDFGDLTEGAIIKLQKKHGLPGSGKIGPITLKLLNLEIDVAKVGPQQAAEWLMEARKYEGRGEHDSAFVKFMAGFWAKIGLPGFKTIIGSKFAWCALFTFTMLYVSGYDTTGLNAAAISTDRFGHSINWRVDGIPQGALIRINGKGDCKGYAGNHVTFANGFCTAQDLLKPSATVSGYGGNQGDKAKVSSYSVSKICAVRYPKLKLSGEKVPLPPKVLKSVNCSNGKSSN
jgi:hypothetical protein